MRLHQLLSAAVKQPGGGRFGQAEGVGNLLQRVPLQMLHDDRRALIVGKLLQRSQHDRDLLVALEHLTWRRVVGGQHLVQAEEGIFQVCRTNLHPHIMLLRLQVLDGIQHVVLQRLSQPGKEGTFVNRRQLLGMMMGLHQRLLHQIGCVKLPTKSWVRSAIQPTLTAPDGTASRFPAIRLVADSMPRSLR